MEFKDVKHVEWGDAVEAIETCYELGWTDGLPVAPPAVERVETFIRAGGRDAHEVLGTLPKRRREITVAMDTHWNPLHVERGLERGESAVTVFAAWGPDKSAPATNRRWYWIAPPMWPRRSAARSPPRIRWAICLSRCARDKWRS